MSFLLTKYLWITLFDLVLDTVKVSMETFPTFPMAQPIHSFISYTCTLKVLPLSDRVFLIWKCLPTLSTADTQERSWEQFLTSLLICNTIKTKAQAFEFWCERVLRFRTVVRSSRFSIWHTMATSSDSFDSEDELDNEMCIGGYRGDIVGIRYYRGTVNNNEMVSLVREPRNPYDRNAVRVDNVYGIQVGHMKKELALALADVIDSKLVRVEGWVCTVIHSTQNLTHHFTSAVRLCWCPRYTVPMPCLQLMNIRVALLGDIKPFFL